MNAEFRAAPARGARRSSGVGPAAGSARSAENARSYADFCALLAITRNGPPNYERFAADLRQRMRPEGDLEEAAFDRLLRAAWRLRLLHQFEMRLPSSLKISPDSGHAARRSERYSRYYAQDERSFFRALAALRKLQAARVGYAHAAAG